MKDGLIRVGAVSPKIRVAAVSANRAAAVKEAKRAAALGVKILVFPELTLTAYTCGDLFRSGTLLDAAERELAAFIQETKGLDMLSFVGLPVAVGGRIYDAVAAVCGGELLALIPKTKLSAHEARVFAAGNDGVESFSYAGQETLFGTQILLKCDTVRGLTVACEIGDEFFAPDAPSVSHAKAGANLIVHPAAMPEYVGAEKRRSDAVRAQSKRLLCAYIHADAGEGESGTDLVFGAHNLIAERGKITAQAMPFADDNLIYTEVDIDCLCSERRSAGNFGDEYDGEYLTVDFALKPCETALSYPPRRLPFVPDGEAERAAVCEKILTVQSVGLAGRLERAHAKQAVIGVSGGLDSTLAMLVAARALDRLGRPRTDLLAVTMPGFGTTARTKGNAEKLAEALGAKLMTVPITDAVRVHFHDIGHDESLTDVVFENAQARERTQILMDIANGNGGLVVGTGDLSELALGWATYNGDHMSMYAPNASVPKTLIRHVVAVCADEEEKRGNTAVAEVLRDVLATPVSPELLPPKDGEIAQCTEGIVGPYELHDFFLYYLVRHSFRPRKILRFALAAFDGVYDEETVHGWLKVFLRRFFTQQFKRSCMPDGPKTGSVDLSPRTDWEMPSDAVAEEWLAEIETEN